MEDYSHIDDIEQLKELMKEFEDSLEISYELLKKPDMDREEIELEIKLTEEKIKDIKLRILELKKNKTENKPLNKNIFSEEEEIERLEREIMIKKQELENETDEYKKYIIGVDIRIMKRRIEFYKEPKWSLF